MSIKQLIKIGHYYNVKYAQADDKAPPTVLYTGVVLDDYSVDKLRNALNDVCPEECEDWLSSNIGSHGYEQLNHHMTLSASIASKINGFDLSLLDSEVELQIIGFGMDFDLGIAAWKVQTSLPVKSGTPHITALMQDGSVKPFLASKIKNWIPISPFTVTGIIKEVKK